LPKRKSAKCPVDGRKKAGEEWQKGKNADKSQKGRGLGPTYNTLTTGKSQGKCGRARCAGRERGSFIR